MKNIFSWIYNKRSLVVYKKAICLSLAFILFFELSAQALLPSQMASEEVSANLKEDLSNAVAEELSPKEFLSDLNETLNKLIAESDESAKSEEDVPTKKTENQFKKEYEKVVQNKYTEYIKEVDTRVQEAIEEFDKQAAEEIEYQTTRLVKEANAPAKPQSDLFAKPTLFDNSPTFITSAITLNKIKRDLKARENETTKPETPSFKVNLTASSTPQLNLGTDFKLNLDTDLTSSKSFAEYQMKEDVKAIKQRQLDEKTQKISKAIEDVKAYIEKQRGLYVQEVNDWKMQVIDQLDAEKTKAINDASRQYKRYSADYDKHEAEVRAEEITYYKDLIHKTVENFKKTELNDYESQENFINILTVLTSIKGKNLDRNKFIVGEDRQFIRNFLYGKFSGNNLNACQGGNVTTYVNNVNYGSCTQLAAGGGSVSAGRMYECQSNKHVEFKLNSEKACHLATSAMLPYANLDGDGYAFTNFIRQYWNAPMFGQVLPMVVKGTLLTNYRGDEALSKFIDDAIAKENTARNSGGGFWDTMNLFTLEGGTNYFMYDGKYCEHNLCASADTGYDSPNAWEEVAHMLADAGKTNILQKATNQCRIVSDANNTSQHLRCGGIYPFLFGTLLYAPERANSLTPRRPFMEYPGQSMDANGRIETITPEKAKVNKQLNDRQDLLKKYGKGELIASYLIYQTFEDVHPTNKMRMINKVAESKALNPSGYIKGYNKDSVTYSRSLTKYNLKQVVWALASYGDVLIAIVATKDLIRIISVGVLKAVNFVSFMKVLRNFKNIPLSFAKSVKLANALKAKGISVEYVSKVNKLRKVAKAPIKVATSAVIARVGGESQVLIGSVGGRITGVRNGILVGTEEVFRPVSKAYNSSATFRQTPLGGIYSTHANNLPIVAQKAQSLTVKDVFTKMRNGLVTALSWLNPLVKANKSEIDINIDKLSLQVFDKKGNPIKVEKITVEDGVLHINGEMFKTFKATLPEEQLQVINRLAAKHHLQFGIEGIYVKPTWKGYKPSFMERFNSKNTVSEMVNVYDETGKVLMQIGLDRAFAPEAALLERLGIKELPWKVARATGRLTEDTHKARLIYMNKGLYLEEGLNLVKVEGLEGFSIPKTAIFNAAKAENGAFLKDLFSMPVKNPAGRASLKFSVTGDKVTPIYLVNMLSYSAASSGLLLTLEQEPFNFTPGQSTIIGLAAPYLTAFTAPLFAPLVSKWGARRFLNISLGTAAAGLGLAVATGYHGQATYQRDEHRRVLTDAEGNKLFKTESQLLPAWPLYFTSFLTGLASSGVRASSNVILKGYEVTKATLTKSMLFKNIGGMSFTLIPFAANAFAKGIHSEKLGIDIEGTGRYKDFSFSYPIILGATLATMGVIRLRMPRMAVPGYQFAKADFVRPWNLLTNPKIWPYVGGMTLACSLEGYVLFKGVSTFAREMWQDPHRTPDYPEDDFLERENAKFLGAFSTALPQILLRGFSPRKAFYGRGLFNSALLATAGTAMLLLPSDDKSMGANIGLGIASGFMVGLGTANVFQYSQKLIIAQADLLKTIPNARRDAQILYSMSNLGLAIPFFFGQDATLRKEQLGETEFDATRHTFHWPLLCYALGMGMIAGAEKNIITNAIFTKPMKYFIKPVLVPTAKTTIGMDVLTRPLRTGSFGPLYTPAVTAPKLNINLNPTMLNSDLQFNTTVSPMNMQIPQAPVPVLNHDDVEEEANSSED